MKRYIYQLITVFIIAFFNYSIAQAAEICNNGIDDDGDGKIDCYDPECAGSCENFFFGKVLTCDQTPQVATPNSYPMDKKWVSNNETADSYATPMVGDLDDDGTPEVISINWIQKKINILSGLDGSLKSTINLDFHPQWQVAIGDVMNDDCAWIFVTEYDLTDSYNSYKVEAYDCNGVKKWSQTATKKFGPGIPGLADFNQDGIPELYYKNEIRNAQTGALLVAGSGGASAWFDQIAFGTLAIDVLPTSACANCGGLELVTGGQIYAVNIAGGTMTAVRNVNTELAAAGLSNYTPRYYRSYVSAADITLDGNLDIIISGAVNNPDGNPHTTVLMWDVTLGTVDTYQDLGNNWTQGTGRISIGDLNFDQKPDLAFISGSSLYALNDKLDLMWKVGVSETTSGFTGCTLFDFEGDGRAEVVYRSEESLVVISTVDGGLGTYTASISPQTKACISRTAEESPIVVDVDGDGLTEICVTCLTDDNMSIQGGNYTNTQYAQVRVYGASGTDVWQPARSVWNQHAYFNVNINDDLTIPKVQQDHSKVLGDKNCVTGAASTTNRPLNGFNGQSPIIDETGCPDYAFPDLAVAGNISTTESTCPDNSFEITFDIQNTGDINMTGTIPVTFYKGNPGDALTNPERLNTELVTINQLAVGNTTTVTLDVYGTGGAFDLYFLLNDFGSNTFPYPSGGTNSLKTGIDECITDNNDGNISITYTPFTLTANKVQDNLICKDYKPANGEAIAYFQGTEPGVVETLWKEDFEGLATGTKSSTGKWSSANSGSTDFHGVRNTFGGNAYEGEDTGSNGLVGQVTWTSSPITISGHTDIKITADLISNSSCDESGPGEDRITFYYNIDNTGDVLLTNGQQSGNFGYIQASKSGLSGNSVVLKCLVHTTSNNEIMAFDNVKVSGTTTPVTKQFTDADGYEFRWFIASDLNDGAPNDTLFVGSEYIGMKEGTYAVVGQAAGLDCFSDTVTVEIKLEKPEFFVWTYTSQKLTNCENPNGELTAFVYTSMEDGEPQDTITDGFQFQWINEDKVTVEGVGAVLGGLDSRVFLVKATQDISGCSFEVTTGGVESNLSRPNIALSTVSITNVTACDVANGILSASMPSPGPYQFEWYIGSGVKPVADYITDKDEQITGLARGNYRLRIKDTITSCYSDAKAIVLGDDSSKPNPVISEVTPNSSCENYNGVMEVVVTGNIADYTFEWSAGNGVDFAQYKLPAATPGSSVVTTANGSRLSGVSEGPYTVKVTRSGCVTQVTGLLTQNFVKPSFELVDPVDTKESVVLNKKAYIELPQLFGAGKPITDGLTISYWANFTTDNYNEDQRIFSSGSTGENQVLLWSDNHNGLAFVLTTQNDNRSGQAKRGRINSGYSADGWAQVAGTWNGTTGEMILYVNAVEIGRTSYIGIGPLKNTGNPMYIGRDGNINDKKFKGELDEVRIYNRPLTQTELFNQLCGELTGSEDGLVAYYNFNNIPSTANNTTVPDASGNGHNGKLKLAGADLSFPTASITCPRANISNNTSCDTGAPNGKINLTGKIIPSGNYNYSIYDGFNTLPANLIETNTTGLFNGLDEGFYTLTAKDPVTKCITIPSTVSVSTVEDTPNIITSTTKDTGCNAVGNGTIKVTSLSASIEPAAGYLYEIFQGASFANEIVAKSDIAIANGNSGHTFTGLTDGNYRIRVTNNTLTCTNYVDVNVGSSSIAPVVSSITVAPNTGCVTANGSLNVEMPGDDTADYTYQWYAGATTSATLLAETGDILRGISSTSPSATGKYTVVATLKATGCASLPQTKTMVESYSYPTVTVNQLQPYTGCGTGVATGQAEAYAKSALGGNTTDGFTFDWFSDAALTPPALPSVKDATSSKASNLTGTTYYVRVTDDATGCSTTKNITIGTAPIYPVVTLTSTKANTACDPTIETSPSLKTVGPNGGATVAVSFNGAAVADFTGYTFTWYEGNTTSGHDITANTGASSNPAITTTATGFNTATLGKVTNATYTVVVTSPGGCQSNALNVTVPFTPAKPAIVLQSKKNNNVCDSLLAGGYDGNIKVAIPITDVNTESDQDYNLQWYEGTGTGGTPINIDISTALIGSNLETSINKLKEGTFTLLVEDLTNGCSNTFTESIIDQPAKPIIVRDSSLVTPNTACNPSEYNGSIVAAIDLAGLEVNGRTNDEIWQAFSSCNSQVLDNATPIGDNGFQLTTETDDQFGRVWLGDSIDLSKPLRLDFKIFLGKKDDDGADGIAFTMHRDPRGYNARGQVGQDLGVGNKQNRTGAQKFDRIEPAVTIEFDTYDNGISMDPAYDHTNLFFNGDIATTALSAPYATGMGNGLPTIHETKTNVEDGDTLDVSIIVTTLAGVQTLELWVDGSNRFQLYWRYRQYYLWRRIQSDWWLYFFYGRFK